MNNLIDDKVVSNNGDIIKVLATVISICKNFTHLFPDRIIEFKGSSLQRTKMYNRIMRMYHEFFTADFTIIVVSINNGYELFDPSMDIEQERFFFKRIK